MISMISGGVKVSVETFYQPEYSNPASHEFMFAYRIYIQNENDFPVQLLTRHWYIFDSEGSRREVTGEGVVGVQPVIRPGESYQYVSGCNLRSEMGRMFGNYTLKNLSNHHEFQVGIPMFYMMAPMKLN